VETLTVGYVHLSHQTKRFIEGSLPRNSDRNSLAFRFSIPLTRIDSEEPGKEKPEPNMCTAAVKVAVAITGITAILMAIAIANKAAKVATLLGIVAGAAGIAAVVACNCKNNTQ
jgi:hypothetical protein